MRGTLITTRIMPDRLPASVKGALVSAAIPSFGQVLLQAPLLARHMLMTGSLEHQ